MKFTKVGANRVQSDQGFVFWMRNPLTFVILKANEKSLFLRKC